MTGRGRRMIQIEERNDVTPLCPHCEEPVGTVHYRQLEGFLGRRYVYFCSRCSKVLGMSHRKGLWMG